MVPLAAAVVGGIVESMLARFLLANGGIHGILGKLLPGIGPKSTAVEQVRATFFAHEHVATVVEVVVMG